MARWRFHTVTLPFLLSLSYLSRRWTFPFCLMFPPVDFLWTGRTQRAFYCQQEKVFLETIFLWSRWCMAGLLTHPWMGSQCRYRDKIPHPHTTSNITHLLIKAQLKKGCIVGHPNVDTGEKIPHTQPHSWHKPSSRSPSQKVHWKAR